MTRTARGFFAAAVAATLIMRVAYADETKAWNNVLDGDDGRQVTNIHFANGTDFALGSSIVFSPSGLRVTWTKASVPLGVATMNGTPTALGVYFGECKNSNNLSYQCGIWFDLESPLCYIQATEPRAYERVRINCPSELTLR
jgi:hypothetical protein